MRNPAPVSANPQGPRFSPSAARLADRWNREASLRRDAGLYREAREARQVADRWAVAAGNPEAFAS